MTAPAPCFRFTITHGVLDKTRSFLLERGNEGCEGCALWPGRLEDKHVVISRVVIPEQVCTCTSYGVCVDLTEEAHFTLPDMLLPGERYYVRIHSHPGRAFHSERDDSNAVISHPGAISVVVPDFAREPIDLRGCAIYRLHRGQGWVRMSEDDIDRTFEVLL